MAQVLEHSRSQVMIAVDPHKASWTAAAVDASLQLLATIRVPVSDDGYRELRGSARLPRSPATPVRHPSRLPPVTLSVTDSRAPETGN